MLREWVAEVAAGRDLETEDAYEAFANLVSGDASPVLSAAFLTALSMKGETPVEIAAFARGMRDRATTITPECSRLVDTCGTGGGAVATFNISTAAAFVAAGAGVSVAKHGNRAVTSRCGSADVLEALGVKIDLSPQRVCECIEQVGIGFLFALTHHSVMRHVAPVRRELPFRTVFNCLGPLANPAGARCQVIGVFEEALAPKLAAALRLLGAERVLVVHGTDGLDEISTLGETVVTELQGGEISTHRIQPGDFGMPTALPDQVAPANTPEENAMLIESILAGEKGPRRDIVALNAAAALVVAGVAGKEDDDFISSMKSGVRLAEEAIDRGAAREKLRRLISTTAH